MSLRLQVSVQVAADPETAWAELTDWAGQSRWIPLTTVRIETESREGVGVRAAALSGVWLGRLPVGLLDRFVVTGWTPPGAGFAELEVLHLGPYFTGEGAFRIDPVGELASRITATEVFSLPGGRAVEAVVGLVLPLMERGFLVSLERLKAIVQHSAALRRTR